jgi:hypothetical protein
MTQVQRDAIVSPQDGSCVYNNDTNVLNIYNGTEWVEVGSGGGGGGGIANWETAKFYEVGDVVIESNKIYQCNTQHTSSVFATDIANWTKLVAPISLTTEVSGVLPMANGGTDKALTPELGGIVYTDGGSMEILGAGTLGQLLKSNGAAAPEWTTLSVDDATFSGVLSLGKGGTNKSLTASNGAIAYSDADSIELLAPGTAGQILQSNGVGAPSYVNKSISGKNENGSSVTLEEIQVSNNQLTQTDVNKHLLESGNSNILANPSFEHSTVSTSWTSSAGTLAAESSVVVNGKKSLSVNLSTQALALTQDSTLYAAQFADGVQGLASVRVKTSLSGIKVCSRQAGVTSTTNCVNVQSNGKWGLYKVPMILGATSNGISIHSNGTSLTGTVYLDDAFVGAVDLKQDVDARRLLGTITITGCSSNHGNSSTSFASLGTATGCSYAVTGSVLAPTTNVQGFRLSSIPVGSIEIIGIGSFGKSGTASNSDVAFQFRDLTNTKNGQDNFLSHVSAGGAAVVTPNVKGTLSYTTAAGTSSFEIFGKTSNITSSGVNVFNFGPHNTNAQPTYYEIWYNGNNSTYSSTNADTDWASCTPTSSQGFGTPTFAVQCKRQGGDLLMKGRFTPSATTAVEARLGLPLWNGVQLISAGSSIIPALEVANGFYLRGVAANAKGGAMLIEPSVAYLTFGTADTYNSSLVNSFSKANANNVASTETLSFNARIPIAGWEQSNIIIGQFNGLESCTNTLECTDTFSAKISSAGVTSDENVDFISGNCSVSATSTFSCTFNSSIFTVAPTCVVTNQEINAATTNGMITSIISSSSSNLSYRTNRHDSVATPYPTNIICQKQGVDYVGKTAKAVASDQNLATPGRLKVKSCTYAFGGASATMSSPTVCSTGTCVEMYDSCSAGSPPTFAGTGLYSAMSFANGTWRAGSPVTCKCEAFINSSASYDCRRYYGSTNPIVADSNGGISFNVFATISQPVAAGNTYNILECTGEAP